MDRQTNPTATTEQNTHFEAIDLVPIELDLQPLLANGGFPSNLLALMLLIYGITTSTERSLRLLMPVVTFLTQKLKAQLRKNEQSKENRP